jgi:hypothetical protein
VVSALAVYFTPVVQLEARFQAAQDLHRLLDGRLVHVHLLEAAGKRVVLLEDAAEFLVRGGADALQRTGRERGLQQVGRVQRAAGGAARADERVDLVDEEDRVRVVHELLQHRLQALLEVAAVLGARQQRAHVERVDLRLGEDLRHLAVDHALGEPLGDGGLADAGFADQQRVVLAAAAKDLHHALELRLAADERVDLAVDGELVQVLREALERARPTGLPAPRPRSRSPRAGPAPGAPS